MNPRHFYFIFLSAISVVKAASTHVDANVNVTVVNGCDVNSDASGDKSTETENSESKKADKNDNNNNNNSSSSSNSSNSNNNNTTVTDADDIQRVVLTPGKHFLISVDPCAGNSPVKKGPISLGFPSSLLTTIATPSKPSEPTTPIIPQVIVPAAKPVVLTDLDEDTQRSIDQQSDLHALTPADLNTKINRFVEFVDLSRKAALNKLIKWPRLVFIGDDDDVKYKVIEKLIGKEGILTPPPKTGESVDNLTPRFPAPIRFTLKNDPNAKDLSFKIDGKQMAGNDLFKDLKSNETIKKAIDGFSLSETAVEVEISGNSIPSIIFIDLPWVLPKSTDQNHANHENQEILSRLIQKYLHQSWNFTVAIGNGNLEFDQWKILSLSRTFDEPMKRIFPISVLSAPVDDKKLHSLLLGLQANQPSLKQGKVYYLNTTENDQTSYSFCTDAKCGLVEFTRGLQIELLRRWQANKQNALNYIQSIVEPIESKISAYDGYWGQGGDIDIEKKLKALIGQTVSILNENLIFFPQDRDTSTCSGNSSLDLINDSIFDKPLQKDQSPIITWSSIFSKYQDDISKLPRVPESIDWTGVKSLISDLKASGATREIISKFKLLLLNPQLETLKVPKTHLIETVKIQWKGKVSKALESKISLEAFSQFKTEILSILDEILKKQVENLTKITRELEESDEMVGWFYNFNPEISTFWLDLMKSESVESALEVLKDKIGSSFTIITGSQSFLQPRLIIKNLLSRETVKLILKTLEETKTDKQKLTEMSVESIAALKTLQERLNHYKDLLKFTD